MPYECTFDKGIATQQLYNTNHFDALVLTSIFVFVTTEYAFSLIINVMIVILIAASNCCSFQFITAFFVYFKFLTM